MSQLAAKNGFGILCLIAMILVATGALLEIARTRRGESILTPNQFRLRMLSALVWLTILGSLSYAVIFLWPQRGDLAGQRKFISVVSGSILLLIIGFFLFAYDMWQLARQRRLQEARFNLQVTQMARDEIARAAEHTKSSVEVSPGENGTAGTDGSR